MQLLHTKVQDDHQNAANLVLCFAAFFIHSFSPWAVNDGFYPFIGTYFPEAREIATLVSALVYVAIALVARWRPLFLSPKALAFIGAACATAGCIILDLSLSLQSSGETLLGMILRLVSDGIAVVFMGAALCSLRNPIAVIVIAAGTTCASYLFRACVPPIGAHGGITIVLVIIAGTILCAYRPARAFLGTISTGEPSANLELSNPNAFLPWRSGLYQCVFVFGVMFGINIAIGEVSHSLIANLGTGIVMALILAWLLRSRETAKEDALFSMAALLIVSGLACVPLGALLYTVETILFSSGSAAFYVLTWLVVFSVAQRSTYAALPVLASFTGLQSLGVLLGAASGHWLVTSLPDTPQTAAAFAMAALVLLFAFLWLGFRDFSFHDTIKHLTELTPTQIASSSGSSNRSGAEEMGLEQTCEIISKRYRLTKREEEILALLARGRNGGYIQEKLVISRNTTKTHIRNIYAKLEVHSHQELIDYVEGFNTSGDN